MRTIEQIRLNQQLSSAVIAEDIATANKLIRKGASCDAQYKSYNNALMYACSSKNRFMAELVLSFNPDLSCVNDMDETAFDIAVREKSSPIIMLLIAAGQKLKFNI